MTKPALTIGILNCGTNRDQWMAEHGDFSDWFKPFLLMAANRPIEFKVFQAHLDDLPGSTEEADAWLITGSPISVYEDPAWQVNLSTFLQQAMQTKPIIGICYGHQLLHHMLGGKVEKMPQWGIGVHTYDALELPTWVSNKASEISLLTSHQDQVTQLAPYSTVLATSTFCANAITQIGSNIFTVQGHPELTRVLASEVYEFRREDQGQELTDQAMASVDKPISDDIFSQWVFDFIDQAHAKHSDVAGVL